MEEWIKIQTRDLNLPNYKKVFAYLVITAKGGELSLNSKGLLPVHTNMLYFG